MEPVRLKFVKMAKKFLDSIFMGLPLPKISPNVVSGMSIITSIIFIFVLDYPVPAFIVLLITFLLDGLDGLIARKYKMASEKGYMVDVFSDRLSEGIVFTPFFVPWFYLFALNSILTVFGYARGKHRLIPLRPFFALYFFFFYVV